VLMPLLRMPQPPLHIWGVFLGKRYNMPSLPDPLETSVMRT